MNTLKTPFTAGEFVHKLILRQKATLLGEGCFAKVLQKPNSTSVIKVGRGQNYLRYVMLALQHADTNPLFPRIYDVTLFKYNDIEHYFVIEMEKLVPWNDVSPPTRRKFLRNFRINGRISPCSIGHPRAKYGKNTYAYRMHNLLKNMYDQCGWDCYDIHSDNIMFRKVGRKYVSAVITDPISEGFL